MSGQQWLLFGLGGLVIGLSGYFVRAHTETLVQPQKRVESAKPEGVRLVLPPIRGPLLGDDLANAEAAQGGTPDEKDAPDNPVEAPVRWTSAAQERDHYMAKVQGSGPAPGALLTKICSIESTWETLVSGAPIKLGAWRCFQGGCTMTARYTDVGASQTAIDRLLTSSAAAQFDGQKFQSGPITLPSGEQEITWIFFAETAEPSLHQE